VIYRPATHRDITPNGIDLVKEATEETSWGDEVFCPLRSLDTLTAMIDNPGDLVGVAATEDELAGVIIGTTHKAMFSPNLNASMCVWYVRPKYRGGWAGYRLARIYRDWAKEMGVTTANFARRRSERDPCADAGQDEARGARVGVDEVHAVRPSRLR
jgi:GNAT superfamily N-acetyltransferase